LLTGAPPGLAAEAPESLAPCLACHGADGQSQIENVPSLGAQTAPYSLIQLFMYREKMRVAEPMNAAANDLTDGELQSIAAALAALPARSRRRPSDPARLRGASAEEQNRCNICHRPDLQQTCEAESPARGLPAEDLTGIQERRAARL
jgi:cytochrome c553